MLLVCLFINQTPHFTLLQLFKNIPKKELLIHCIEDSFISESDCVVLNKKVMISLVLESK